MLHNAAFYRALHCLFRRKAIFRQNTVLDHTLTYLEMDKTKCIKPEGRIH